MALEDELDRAIERALARSAVDGAGQEDVVCSKEIADLVRLASHLQETAPQPSAACRERVWSRVKAEALEQRPRRWAAVGGLGWHGSLLARIAAVVVVALLLGSTVVGVSAANSLPDSSLYPLKLALEQGQIALTFDPADRANLDVAFAERRLEEVLALERAGRGVGANALEAMASATARASETLETVDEPAKDDLSAKVIRMTSRQQEVLQTILSRAPEPALPGLQRALQASQKAQEKAAEQTKTKPADKPGLGPKTAPGQEKQATPPGQPAKSGRPDKKTPANGGDPPRGGRSPQPTDSPKTGD